MKSIRSNPAPWNSADLNQLRKIQGVCLDIDDTLSSSGKLTAEAYSALWSLQKAGFQVIPITGRPAGWCDLIARFWPVNAVVGENGAFTFFVENGVRKRIDTPAGKSSQTLKQKLSDLAEKIKKTFPEAQWASDQDYREFDLAIDICEDVPPWKMERVDALLALCHEEGAFAKLSSIHVNTWFGDYDKKRGFEYWVSQGCPGAERKINSDQWLYIGDSPNDEPMFRFFESSVGVANLSKYLDRLTYPPQWMTSKESGDGFVEMAERLIQARRSTNDKS